MRRTIDNVGVFGLFLNQLHGVKIAVDEADFGVLRCDFGAFVRVADEAGDFPFWVFFVDKVEGIAADVPSDSCLGTVRTGMLEGLTN